MRFENNLTSMLSASIAIKKYKCHGKEIWNAVAAIKYAWRSITCTASMSWWLLSRSRMFFFAFPNAFTILFYLNATNSIKSTAHRCNCVRVFFRIILCFFFCVLFWVILCFMLRLLYSLCTCIYFGLSVCVKSEHALPIYTVYSMCTCVCVFFWSLS